MFSLNTPKSIKDQQTSNGFPLLLESNSNSFLQSSHTWLIGPLTFLTTSSHAVLSFCHYAPVTLVFFHTLKCPSLLSHSPLHMLVSLARMLVLNSWYSWPLLISRFQFQCHPHPGGLSSKQIPLLITLELRTLFEILSLLYCHFIHYLHVCCLRLSWTSCEQKHSSTDHCETPVPSI